MPGKRLNMGRQGIENEDLTKLLVGKLASMIKVLYEEDYGIDFYFHPIQSVDRHTHTVTTPGTLQVKGPQSILSYGGNASNGAWKRYEIDWLKSLSAPLFLATTIPTENCVNIYSLARLWQVLQQTLNPWKIICKTRPASFSAAYYMQTQDIGSKASDKAPPESDGRTWEVDLGPPFIQLNIENVKDADFVKSARAELMRRIEVDRKILANFQSRIGFSKMISAWTTNKFPHAFDDIRDGQFVTVHSWNPEDDERMTDIGWALLPALTNLATHLQWRNDPKAYDYIPILSWLEQRGVFDPMSHGLLLGLQTSRDAGKMPKDGIS